MRSSTGSLGAATNRLGSNSALWSSATRHQPACLREQFDELGDDRVQVSYHREVTELEDRCVRVLVHGDDRLRVLHPDPVLHRAGDPKRDVKLGRHRLAGLADLRRRGIPALVHRGAGRADRAAEDGGELLGELEALRAAEADAAGDDDVGPDDRRAFVGSQRAIGDPRRERVLSKLHDQRLDCRLAPRRGRHRLERASSEQRDPVR